MRKNRVIFFVWVLLMISVGWQIYHDLTVEAQVTTKTVTTRKELQDLMYKKYGSKGFVIAREYVIKPVVTNPFDPSFNKPIYLYQPTIVQIGSTEISGDVYYGSGPSYESAYLDAVKRYPHIWDGL
jgi:hypothetical protein